MKKGRKRGTAWFLVLCMILSLVTGIPAQAAGDDAGDSGLVFNVDSAPDKAGLVAYTNFLWDDIVVNKETGETQWGITGFGDEGSEEKPLGFSRVINANVFDVQPVYLAWYESATGTEGEEDYVPAKYIPLTSEEAEKIELGGLAELSEANCPTPEGDGWFTLSFNHVNVDGAIVEYTPEDYEGDVAQLTVYSGYQPAGWFTAEPTFNNFLDTYFRSRPEDVYYYTDDTRTVYFALKDVIEKQEDGNITSKWAYVDADGEISDSVVLCTSINDENNNETFPEVVDDEYATIEEASNSELEGYTVYEVTLGDEFDGGSLVIRLANQYKEWLAPDEKNEDWHYADTFTTDPNYVTYYLNCSEEISGLAIAQPSWNPGELENDGSDDYPEFPKPAEGWEWSNEWIITSANDNVVIMGVFDGGSVTAVDSSDNLRLCDEEGKDIAAEDGGIYKSIEEWNDETKENDTINLGEGVFNIRINNPGIYRIYYSNNESETESYITLNCIAPQMAVYEDGEYVSGYEIEYDGTVSHTYEIKTTDDFDLTSVECIEVNGKPYDLEGKSNPLVLATVEIEENTFEEQGVEVVVTRINSGNAEDNSEGKTTETVEGEDAEDGEEEDGREGYFFSFRPQSTGLAVDGAWGDGYESTFSFHEECTSSVTRLETTFTHFIQIGTVNEEGIAEPVKDFNNIQLLDAEDNTVDEEVAYIKNTRTVWNEEKEAEEEEFYDQPGLYYFHAEEAGVYKLVYGDKYAIIIARVPSVAMYEEIDREDQFVSVADYYTYDNSEAHTYKIKIAEWVSLDDIVSVNVNDNEVEIGSDRVIQTINLDKGAITNSEYDIVITWKDGTDDDTYDDSYQFILAGPVLFGYAGWIDDGEEVEGKNDTIHFLNPYAQFESEVDTYTSKEFYAYFGFRESEDDEFEKVTMDMLVYDESKITLKKMYSEEDGEPTLDGGFYRILFKTEGDYTIGLKDTDYVITFHVTVPAVQFYEDATLKRRVFDDVDVDKESKTFYMALDLKEGHVFDGFEYSEDEFKISEVKGKEGVFKVVLLGDTSRNFDVNLVTDYEGKKVPEYYDIYVSLEVATYTDGVAQCGYVSSYITEGEFLNGNWKEDHDRVWFHADSVQAVVDKAAAFRNGESDIELVDEDSNPIPSDTTVFTSEYIAVGVSYDFDIELPEDEYLTVPTGIKGVSFSSGSDRYRCIKLPTGKDFYETYVFEVNHDNADELFPQLEDIDLVAEYYDELYKVTEDTESGYGGNLYTLGEKIQGITADENWFKEYVNKTDAPVLEDHWQPEIPMPNIHVELTADISIQGKVGSDKASETAPNVHIMLSGKEEYADCNAYIIGGYDEDEDVFYEEGIEGECEVIASNEDYADVYEPNVKTINYLSETEAANTYYVKTFIPTVTAEADASSTFKNAAEEPAITIEEEGSSLGLNNFILTYEDEKNNESTGGDGQKETGLSDELTQAVENGSELTISVKADEVKEETLDSVKKDKIQSVIDKNVSVDADYDSKYVDITLNASAVVEDENGTEKTIKSPISKTREEMTISVDNPFNFEQGKYFVVRYHNGFAELIRAILIGGKLIFKTDRFSDYAIVGRPATAFESKYEDLLDDLSNAEWRLDEDSFTYNGEEQKPEVHAAIVTTDDEDGDEEIEVDFEEKYSDLNLELGFKNEPAKDAGKYSVSLESITIQDDGDDKPKQYFAGNDRDFEVQGELAVPAVWSINKLNLNNYMLIVDISEDSYEFDGTEKSPEYELVVPEEIEKWIEVDSYEGKLKAVDAGEYVITAKINKKDDPNVINDVSVEDGIWTIDKFDLSEYQLEWTGTRAYTYNGKEQTADYKLNIPDKLAKVVEVTYEGTSGKEAKDYEITATVTCKYDKDNYIGDIQYAAGQSAKATWVINECEHKNTELTGEKAATETEEGYTGDKVCKECGEIVESGTVIPKIKVEDEKKDDTGAADNKAKADAVTSTLNALPASSAVTTADEAKITEARKAYDALTDDQKKLVSADTVKKLTDAEAALEDAKKAAAVPAEGATVTDDASKATYIVTTAAKVATGTTAAAPGEVTYTGSADKSAAIVKVPASITTTDGATYNVTAIAAGAFKNNKKLTGVTIPNTVTAIGASAFENDTALKKVTIPASVTEIGAKAFKKCTKMTKVVIGKSVKKIGASAFEGDKSLKTVTFKGSAVESIGAGAFKNCKKLKSIVIPKSVKTIGKNAFNGCKQLKKITFKGTSVKKIGTNAFKGVPKTSKAKVPKKKLTAYQKLLKKAKFTGKVKK